MEKARLQDLMEALRRQGYTVIGPRIWEGAIVYDEVHQTSDLPIGWTDEQDGGQYRLRRREDQAFFGYAVGPHSWKRFLHPPVLSLGRARRLEEAPDITARICGICPVAYQMSACNALESLLGLSVGGPIRDLRLLLYYGEWIESHALHMFLLHLPDFLGYESAFHMARDHPDWVQKGLQIGTP
jgi:hypothetical protein